MTTTTLAGANQKGGVAKTTTVASLGAALVEQGQRVLLVARDPHACRTLPLGSAPAGPELAVHHALTKGLDARGVSVTREDGADRPPATIEPARAEAALRPRSGRE